MVYEMSLDVYLTIEDAFPDAYSSGIFVREDGQIKEISRAEWDAKFPGREPVVAPSRTGDNGVYQANITHNLNKMAGEAGIYQALWRPEEIGITKAAQLIDPLRDGLALLESDPERFKALNPSNGWGSYESLVEFVRKYLAACEKYPQARIKVSR